MRPRVLFDTTRIAWRARRGSPTGVDRVLVAYAEWLLASETLAVRPVALVGQWMAPVSKARLAALIAGMKAADETPGDWPELIAALKAAAPTALRRPVESQGPADWLPLGLDVAGRAMAAAWSGAPRGDLYLNVAHTGLHRPGLLPGLKRQGVKPVVMVHDLIPVTHPEFCTPASGPRHRQRMDSVVDHAALVIANSKATADDLAVYARASGRAAPSTLVAHLGLSDAFGKGAKGEAGLAPYFVVVGTIEARKNLAFLLAVWRGLAERLGARCPHLVIVGRRGWENEAVIDHLERSPPLRSLVHEVADLTDAHLARLIAGARALLAPSFAEGFDLPVMEALAVGAPVIASDVAAHRELATGATLLDPLDGPGWAAAITAATTAKSARKPLAPPTWAAHFTAVEQRLLELAHA